MPTDDRYRNALGARRRAFIPDGDGEPLELEAVRNPPRSATFGWVGAHAEVKGAPRGGAGVLVLAVDEKSRGTVAPETLRLFRWDADARRLALVEESGCGDGSFVWGRVEGGGRYAAIGLETDPAVLGTIRALAAVRDVPAMSEADRKALHVRVCELLLCTPDGHGGGKTRCEACRALTDPFDLPELELLALLPPAPSAPPEPVASPLDADAFPAEGGISGMALDPDAPGRLYVAGESGGMWRLDGLDDGAAGPWAALAALGARVVRAVVAGPAGSGVVYLADESGQVIRSPDRGATWAGPGAMRFRRVWRIAVHPADPDSVFVASGSAVDGEPEAEGETGLWGSPDGGRTWTELLTGDTLDAAVDPDDGSVLYVAVRDEGLFMSTQSGQAWMLAMPFVSAAAHGGSMIRVALGRGPAGSRRTVAVRFGQEIFVNRHGGRPRSQEGGGPWISIGGRGGDGPGGRQVIAVDPYDDDVLLTGGERLMRTGSASAPAGGEWARVAGARGRRSSGRWLEFDPLRRGVVYHAHAAAIQRSTDGGVTWSPVGAPADKGR